MGGCSCIPAVKKALRRACRDSGVNKFVQKKAISSTSTDTENTSNNTDMGTANTFGDILSNQVRSIPQLRFVSTSREIILLATTLLGGCAAC